MLDNVNFFIMPIFYIVATQTQRSGVGACGPQAEEVPSGGHLLRCRSSTMGIDR